MEWDKDLRLHTSAIDLLGESGLEMKDYTPCPLPSTWYLKWERRWRGQEGIQGTAPNLDDSLGLIVQGKGIQGSRI